MGFFDFLKPKCSFCKKQDGLVRHVSDDAYYGHMYYYYHEECWKKVLASPRDYSNKEVDFALEVSDSLFEEEKRKKDQENRAKIALERMNHGKDNPS